MKTNMWYVFCPKFEQRNFSINKRKENLNVAGLEAIKIENLLRNRNEPKSKTYLKICIL